MDMMEEDKKDWRNLIISFLSFLCLNIGHDLFPFPLCTLFSPTYLSGFFFFFAFLLLPCSIR